MYSYKLAKYFLMQINLGELPMFEFLIFSRKIRVSTAVIEISFVKNGLIRRGLMGLDKASLFLE